MYAWNLRASDVKYVPLGVLAALRFCNEKPPVIFGLPMHYAL